MRTSKNNSLTQKAGNRLYWGKSFSKLPLLDLIAVQKESYQWFLETGVAGLLRFYRQKLDSDFWTTPI